VDRDLFVDLPLNPVLVADGLAVGENSGAIGRTSAATEHVGRVLGRIAATVAGDLGFAVDDVE
jgi:hypothetical protein